MDREHTYTLGIEWIGNLGAGTTNYSAYGRNVTVTAAGKHPIEGSADKPFRGDVSRWNPEELLLAALAQCHLLSYLYVATTENVVVTSYVDRATGVLEESSAGGRFREVVLHPRVTVADSSMVDAALRAHKRANELCFIARSVNFPVLHDPEIIVATGSPTL